MEEHKIYWNINSDNFAIDGVKSRSNITLLCEIYHSTSENPKTNLSEPGGCLKKDFQLWNECGGPIK